jgi:hypothetical protein
MDKLESYRQLIKKIFREYVGISNSPDDTTETVPVFDDANNRYLLLTYGRENKKRVHSCWAHVEIRDGKFWIHFDGTEEGIAAELLKNDVPKSDIVLAFKSPEMRKYTDFALA